MDIKSNDQSCLTDRYFGGIEFCADACSGGDSCLLQHIPDHRYREIASVYPRRTRQVQKIQII